MELKRKEKKPLRQVVPKLDFPEVLAERFEELLERTRENGIGKRIAVFDLDNTLLDGDIGDASIAHLLDNEIPIGMTWSQYIALIDEGRNEEAYMWASSAFAGMEDTCVRNFANVVLTMKDKYITFFESDLMFKVLVPKPNYIMKELVERLQDNNFKIYIISASNQYLVEEAGSMFGISKKNCFGMRQQVSDMGNVIILEKKLIAPIPYSTGKAEISIRETGGHKPLFTSGDSLSDLHYLQLTHENGLILWRGSDADFAIARKSIPENIQMLNFNSLF